MIASTKALSQPFSFGFATLLALLAAPLRPLRETPLRRSPEPPFDPTRATPDSWCPENPMASDAAAAISV